MWRELEIVQLIKLIVVHGTVTTLVPLDAKVRARDEEGGGLFRQRTA